MRMIPAPAQIQVGARVYSVEVAPELLANDGMFGEVNHTTYTIRLQPLVNHHKCSEVFWHEVIHCVASVWLNGKLDEETADALGQGVHQVLRGMGIEIDWGSMAGSSPPEACQERLKPQAEQ